MLGTSDSVRPMAGAKNTTIKKSVTLTPEQWEAVEAIWRASPRELQLTDILRDLIVRGLEAKKLDQAPN